MMRKLIVLAAALAAPSLFAAPPTSAQVKTYVEHAFAQCPAQSFTVTQIQQDGPAGFDIYKAEQKSSDEYCGSQKYFLVSPKTGQTILGTIIKLPEDSRPVHIRASEHATNVLKTPVSARIAPMLLPDGLKAIAMTRDTQFGQFSYNGFIDASERFMMIGMRGNINEKPEQTLREQLGLANGAQRGSAKSKTEIIELSDFECPTCGRAHKMLEPIVSKNVSKVNYIRLDLPLFEHHEWALQAAMGARALQRVAPAKYWEYVNDVFANQQKLTVQSIDDFVKNWMTDRDIDWNAINAIYSSKSDRQALLDQVSRAFAVGIASTPTYIINGQAMGFGPEGEYTVNAVRKALGLAPVKIASEAPKKK
jgi:protein-disulfide isomerase